MAFTTNYYISLINHCPLFILFIFGRTVKKIALEDIGLQV